MVRPSHLIVLLLAVCLSGCGGYAMFDPSAAFTSPAKQADWTKGGSQAAVPEAADYETTATTPAASSKPESTAQSSLFTQASETKLAAPPAPVVATRKADRSRRCR